MHQYVRVVHSYPFGIAQPVYGKGLGIGTLACEVPDGFYNGCHLAGRVSLADDEIIAYCIVDFVRFCDDDFFLFYLEYLLLSVESVFSFSFIIQYYIKTVDKYTLISHIKHAKEENSFNF